MSILLVFLAMFHLLFVWMDQMSCQYSSYIAVDIWVGG
jgi:hypothetical protein